MVSLDLFRWKTTLRLCSGYSVAIIGDDGVLVVDSGHTPSTTAHIISDIKRLTDKPVRFLVNTHS